MLERKSGAIIALGSTLTYLPFSNFYTVIISNAYDFENKATGLQQNFNNATISVFAFSETMLNENKNVKIMNKINKNYNSKFLKAEEIVQLSLEVNKK